MGMPGGPWEQAVVPFLAASPKAALSAAKTARAVEFWTMKSAQFLITSFPPSPILQMLAKLACGLNKPNRQTLVSSRSVPQLFSQMPVSSMWVLGSCLLLCCLGLRLSCAVWQEHLCEMLVLHFLSLGFLWGIELCLPLLLWSLLLLVLSLLA